MKNIFVSNIIIENVRHLRNIDITLSKEEAKHLIFTGKNGSGKTSALDALSNYLNTLATSNELTEVQLGLQPYKFSLENLQQLKCGVSVEFNEPAEKFRHCFEKGQFILAYYKADRIFKADIPKHVEKVNLKGNYSINEEPRQVFVKYLLDLKVTEALARSNGNTQRAGSINNWFIKFQELLKRIFDDESLELIFEEDTFKFYIKEKNRELFDFNTLSSGLAGVLDIVVDIIVRMEKATNKPFEFNLPGIVLIDEIEAHLHIELQKCVLELLTSVFPNIQFIVSTYSPFILNSLDNVVIYDLDNNITVKDGLSNVPYEAIVEGYFKTDSMSNLLKKKYNRYKELAIKQDLTDDDFKGIADLEVLFNEIPDYLALNITTEYKRLKTEKIYNV